VATVAASWWQPGAHEADTAEEGGHLAGPPERDAQAGYEDVPAAAAAAAVAAAAAPAAVAPAAPLGAEAVKPISLEGAPLVDPTYDQQEQEQARGDLVREAELEARRNRGFTVAAGALQPAADGTSPELASPEATSPTEIALAAPLVAKAGAAAVANPTPNAAAVANPTPNAAAVATPSAAEAKSEHTRLHELAQLAISESELTAQIKADEAKAEQIKAQLAQMASPAQPASPLPPLSAAQLPSSPISAADDEEDMAQMVKDEMQRRKDEEAKKHEARPLPLTLPSPSPYLSP